MSHSPTRLASRSLRWPCAATRSWRSPFQSAALFPRTIHGLAEHGAWRPMVIRRRDRSHHGSAFGGPHCYDARVGVSPCRDAGRDGRRFGHGHVVGGNGPVHRRAHDQLHRPPRTDWGRGGPLADPAATAGNQPACRWRFRIGKGRSDQHGSNRACVRRQTSIVPRMMAQMSHVGIDDLLTATTWGQAGLLQCVGGAIAHCCVCRGATRRRAIGWGLATFMMMVLALTPALSGHAVASPRLTALAVGADTLHVIGAGWGGWVACSVSRRYESRIVLRSTATNRLRMLPIW